MDHYIQYDHIHGMDHMHELTHGREIKKDDRVFLHSVNERPIQRHWCHASSVVDAYLFDEIGLPQENVSLIVNDALNFTPHTRVENIKTVNWFAMFVYYHITTENHPYNKEWSRTNTPLFLLGKAEKPHRGPLLYFLTKQPCFSDLVYSYDPCYDTESYDMAKLTMHRVLPEIDYCEFSKKYARTLDLSDTVTSIYSYHYSGFPYDVSLYEDTGFSIVSETENHDWDQPPFTTEKIWKAIANNHPFLLIGGYNCQYQLKKCGYKMFDYIWKYDDLRTFFVSDRERAEMVADNVQYVYDTIHKHTDRILEDTAHNRINFIKYCEREIEKTWNGDIAAFNSFAAKVKYGNLHNDK